MHHLLNLMPGMQYTWLFHVSGASGPSVWDLLCPDSKLTEAKLSWGSHCTSETKVPWAIGRQGMLYSDFVYSVWSSSSCLPTSSLRRQAFHKLNCLLFGPANQTRTLSCRWCFEELAPVYGTWRKLRVPGSQYHAAGPKSVFNFVEASVVAILSIFPLLQRSPG